MTRSPEERWKATLAGAQLADPEGLHWRELQALYGQRHRHYHDLDHVLDCLRTLEANAVDGSDAVSIELAIWFHDAIYEPLRSDNEKASADWAVACLAEMTAGPALQSQVRRLILVTTHDREPSDLDEALMVDVDLSILGRDRGTYETYETAIRCEYRMVPGPLFRRKRRQILEAFLARPRIYHNETYRQLYEVQARSNLQWAIERL